MAVIRSRFEITPATYNCAASQNDEVRHVFRFFFFSTIAQSCKTYFISKYSNTQIQVNSFLKVFKYLMKKVFDCKYRYTYVKSFYNYFRILVKFEFCLTNDFQRCLTKLVLLTNGLLKLKSLTPLLTIMMTYD